MKRAKVRSKERRQPSDSWKNSIPQAFLLSVLFHFVAIATLELGSAAGFWNHSLLKTLGPSSMQKAVEELERRSAELQKRLEKTAEAEMVFVDVDPSQAVAEPPKETPFYSTANTIAANAEVAVKSEAPNLDGKQEHVPKMNDTMRPDPLAMRPAPEPEPQTPEPENEPPKMETPEVTRPPQEAKPELKPEGDMLIARAAPRPQEKTEYVPEPVAPRPRPRTLAEARAQQGILQGPKLRQRGGVNRLGVDGMDVAATPFGAYDAAFIAAVQARWFNLLDERDFVGNQSGKVVVEFNLNRDGRITALRVGESEVSETLSWICQRAILDPAPYRPFPPDLRRMMQRDYRPVRFTFYYNQ